MMNVFLLLAAFVYLLENVLTLPNICNPIECFIILDNLFKIDSEEEPCLKVTKLERCASVCSSWSPDNVVLKGIQEVKKDLCGGDSDSAFKLANKCGNKHKYLLFACIYENLHLEAKYTEANQNLLMCRKASEGQNCERQSLSYCTEREYYLSGRALQSFFRPMYVKNCHFSIGDIFELKLKPSAYMNDYKLLADCLDKNSPYIVECAPKKWIGTNALMDVHFVNKLCRAGDSFLTCVQSVVENKCKEVENVYATIGQSLYRTFLPQCVKQTEISSALKNSDKNFNEVYDQALTPTSAEQPKNASEVVVVHHHVVNVIDVKYHKISAATFNRATYAITVMSLLSQCHYLKFIV